MSQKKKTQQFQFWGIFPYVFARNTRSEVRELYVNSAILELANSMILFFEPIYLFQLGLSLQHIILFYLGVYVIYFCIMPLGGKFARKYGFEHSIVLASPLLILYYLSLVFAQDILLFLIPGMFFLALQKMFYWPGYHADFAHYGQEFEQGREVSNVTVLTSLVTVLGPLFGGAIMYFFDFKVLFIVVSILIWISNIPLVITPEKFNPKPFSYIKAYKRLFKTYNRRRFIAFLGFGEEFILLTLWPIFIFIVVGNVLNAGIMVASATFITVIAVLYVGKLTDEKEKSAVLRLATVFYALVWLFRITIRTPVGVFFGDTFSKVGKNALQVPLRAMTYHEARKWGVVKNVVFLEMALVVGKILSMAFILLLMFFLPEDMYWSSIFYLAAAFTLLYTLLK